MDEKDIIGRLGPPDKIVSIRERMRSRGWVCPSCGNLTTATEPIPAPAPCRKCGGIFFETVALPPN